MYRYVTFDFSTGRVQGILCNVDLFSRVFFARLTFLTSKYVALLAFFCKLLCFIGILCKREKQQQQQNQLLHVLIAFELNNKYSRSWREREKQIEETRKISSEKFARRVHNLDPELTERKCIELR